MTYQIKPGRGPSAMEAVGGVFAAIFGEGWMIFAAQMGAPGFFVAFGAVFVLMAVGGVVYNAHNATSKNRFSTFEVTTDTDGEVDPISQALGYYKSQGVDNKEDRSPGGKEFCPYCGYDVDPEHAFCAGCGKAL